MLVDHACAEHCPRLEVHLQNHGFCLILTLSFSFIVSCISLGRAANRLRRHCCSFQIVDLPGAVDSDANNGSWRIGDWADTLELPNIGEQAIVRWVPGPYEITGRFQKFWQS